MGSCVSTPNRRSGSRKFYSRSKKRCGKISALVPDEPSTRKRDTTNYLTCRENDQFENVSSTRRRAEVSNLTAHLTQLQWHRIREVRCVLSQEEDWFDFETILESDFDNDDNHIHEAVTNSHGSSSTLPYETTLFPLDSLCKSEKLNDGTPVSLAVQNSTKINQDKTEILLSIDGMGEGIQVFNLGDSEIAFQEVDEVQFTNNEQFCTRTNYLEDTYVDFRHGTEGNNHESILKELKPSCTSQLVFPISFHDNIEPNPAVSAQSLEWKLAVIQISYKKKSKDDEISQIYASRCYLCRPKTGFAVLCSSVEKTSEELWNKRSSPAPNHIPDTPIGIDIFLSHCQVDHIAQHIEFPCWPADLTVMLLPDYVWEGASLQFRDNFRKLSSDATKSLEHFLAGFVISDWERQKFESKFNNLEVLLSNITEKGIVNNCIEYLPPPISEPGHKIYEVLDLSKNNLNMDINHLSSVSRRLEAILQQLKLGSLGFNLFIQELKEGELLELVLCCRKL